jgi:hypothetical protein
VVAYNRDRHLTLPMVDAYLRTAQVIFWSRTRTGAMSARPESSPRSGSRRTRSSGSGSAPGSSRRRSHGPRRKTRDDAFRTCAKKQAQAREDLDLQGTRLRFQMTDAEVAGLARHMAAVGYRDMDDMMTYDALQKASEVLCR